MELKLSEILSVSGTPGLFRYVAQANGGIIVESLDGTAKRSRIAGNAKVSALGDIAIFTHSGELSLGEVFDKAFAVHSGAKVDITNKSTPAELATFMSGILEDHDTQRVHNSDIKKLALWYNLLVAVGMTKFAETEQEVENHEAGSSPKKSASTAVSAAKKSPVKSAVNAKSGAVSSKSKAATGKSTTARKAQ